MSNAAVDVKHYVFTDMARNEYFIVTSREETDFLAKKLREEGFVNYRRVEGTRDKFTLIVRNQPESTRILQRYVRDVF